MKAILPQLRSKLTTDAEYFRSVYLHTFDYAKSEGQRSIPVDTAKAFWQLLLPVGLRGAALAHSTEGEDGWKSEYTDWWYEFLDGKGLKGVSRDTWNMASFCSVASVVKL
jgi:DCN1-like protein 1/2